MRCDIFKKKSKFYKLERAEWEEHVLALQLANKAKDGNANSPNAELWQITIQSYENIQKNKLPEEVFLLNAVEQVTTGTDFEVQLPGQQAV